MTQRLGRREDPTTTTTTPPLISRALQENLYGNAVTIAGREIVEGESGDQILCEATGADIAFLVVGHPFG